MRFYAALVSRDRSFQCTWEIMKYVKTLLLAGLSIPLALSCALADQISSLPTHELEMGCEGQSCEADTDLQQARDYLIKTARPGGTMVRQGPDLAIERLHPEFAKRLAAAIQAARNAGLDEAGIFSAYRPPVFGVGGFADKYYSLHAYGLAVDMYGIGRPGSPEAQQWHEIAAAHGIVCPYGYRSRVEWNHCQPTRLEAVKAENPLRETIAGSGPIDLERMFEVGSRFIANAESTIATVVAERIVRPVNVIRALVHARHQARNSQQAAISIRISSRMSRASRLAARQTRLPGKSVQPARAKLALLTKRPK